MKRFFTILLTVYVVLMVNACSKHEQSQHETTESEASSLADSDAPIDDKMILDLVVHDFPESTDTDPEFPGGDEALEAYLENIPLPKKFLKNLWDIELWFGIDKEGKVINPRLIIAQHDGVNPCSPSTWVSIEEQPLDYVNVWSGIPIRVSETFFDWEENDRIKFFKFLRDMPRWKPATFNGNKVNYWQLFKFIDAEKVCARYGIEYHERPKFGWEIDEEKYIHQDLPSTSQPIIDNDGDGRIDIAAVNRAVNGDGRNEVEKKSNGDKSGPEKIFTAVEEQAKFPGGASALTEWISNNLRYPELAQANGIEGTVTVKFTVEKDGHLTDPVIVKGVDKDLDKEAIRIIKKMPKWIPGKNNGQVVRSYFTLPVSFSLQ